MLPLVLGRDSESDATPGNPPAERGVGMMGILALVKLQQPGLPNVAFCRINSGISVSFSLAADAPECIVGK